MIVGAEDKGQNRDESRNELKFLVERLNGRRREEDAEKRYSLRLSVKMRAVLTVLIWVAVLVG